MSDQPAAVPPKAPRRTGLLALGLLVLIGGIGAGAAMALRASSQYTDAVTRLQRAPVGCDTQFDFTGTGTFTFFIETKGKIGTLRGDCANTETSYARRPGKDLPQVTLTLLDAGGAEVKLTRSSDMSYDAGGFVGTSTRTLALSESATYTLTVESDDTDFAIAVGRDPKGDYDQQRAISLGIAAGALLIGGVLTALGIRRKAAPPTPAQGVVPMPPAPFGTPQTWMSYAQPQEPLPQAPQPGSPFAPPSWEPPHQAASTPPPTD